MPVSLTTTTSQASRSAPLARAGAAKCGEPDSSSPSIEQLDGDGGGVPAGGGEVGAHAEQVEGDVALVVDGAAGVQLGAVGALDDGRLERRVLPQLQRVDRLHVVVAVDERDRRVRRRRSATRRRPRARPAVGQISTVGKPARRSASASHSALPATSAACAGSAEIDGMRSQASRSACRSSRWAVRSRARGCSRPPTVARCRGRPAAVHRMRR